MTDLEKLRIMLPHWIEHNKSHSGEFKKWMEIVKDSGDPEIAGVLEEASAGLEIAGKALTKALDKLGGPPAETDNHSHHHH